MDNYVLPVIAVVLIALGGVFAFGGVGESIDDDGNPYREVVCEGNVDYALIEQNNVEFQDVVCRAYDDCRRTNLLSWYDNVEGVVTMYDSKGKIPGLDSVSDELGIGVVDNADGFEVKGCTADEMIVLRFSDSEGEFSESIEVEVK